jgi:hypothetical protein
MRLANRIKCNATNKRQPVRAWRLAILQRNKTDNMSRRRIGLVAGSIECCVMEMGIVKVTGI